MRQRCDVLQTAFDSLFLMHMYSSNEFTSSLTKQLESSETLVISAITLEQYVISATCLYLRFRRDFFGNDKKNTLLFLLLKCWIVRELYLFIMEDSFPQYYQNVRKLF